MWVSRVCLQCCFCPRSVSDSFSWFPCSFFKTVFRFVLLFPGGLGDSSLLGRRRFRLGDHSLALLSMMHLFLWSSTLIHHNRFQISLLLPFLSTFEVEKNLTGSRPTVGVLKIASLMGHTCSGLSCTSQILTAQCTNATHSTHLASNN